MSDRYNSLGCSNLPFIDKSYYASGCAYLELCTESQTLPDACAGHGLCSKTVVRQCLGWHLACCTGIL